MVSIHEQQKKVTGFFTQKFYYAFRALFHPITRFLMWAGVRPNTVTVFSLFLGALMGVFFAVNNIWAGLLFGYVLGFSDIVDGQLAKAYGKTTKFGGILDSTIDRFNEFFLYTGLGIRYFVLGRPWWTLICGFIFLNSVMISYIKARAEADGFECNIGLLQRPERLALIAVGLGFGLLFHVRWIDITIAALAILIPFTFLQRLIYVYRQCT